MKLNEKRMIEVVLIILFPAALFAGCAGNGNEKPEMIGDAAVTETQVNEASIYDTQENVSQVYEIQDTALYSDEKHSENEMANLEIEQNSVLDHMVYFKTDKYSVQAEAESLIAQYASKLKSNPNAYLTINGHADERGSKEYNLNLSQQRAQEVEARLLSLGVPNSQLRIHSYGEAIPIASLSDWQENRRVELEYTKATVSNNDNQENSKVSPDEIAELAVGSLDAENK